MDISNKELKQLIKQKTLECDRLYDKYKNETDMDERKRLCKIHNKLAEETNNLIEDEKKNRCFILKF